MTEVKYLVIGGGIAGVTAALKLREMEPEGSILMITKEKKIGSRRPLLSKTGFRQYTKGHFDASFEEIFKEKKIILYTETEAKALDPERHSVETTCGTIVYEKCILALGAENRIIPWEGTDLPGVFSIRREADYLAVRRKALMQDQVVIIGGGVIGMEMAELLMQEGKAVTVLETAPSLMPRILDSEMGRLYQKAMEEKGLKVICGVNVEKILGQDKVIGVQTDQGCIECGMVILSCGIKAASLSGLPFVNGFPVDGHMKVMNDLYVCGDCALYEGKQTALWMPAIRMAQVAAGNAAGETAVYEAGTDPVIVTSGICSLFAAGKTVLTEEEKALYEVTLEEAIINERGKVMPLGQKVCRRLIRREGKLCGVVLLGNLSEMTMYRKELEEVCS